MPTPICPICRETLYKWKLPHTCKPAWQCVVVDRHEIDEPITVYSDAFDEQGVAETCAALHNDDGESSWEIWVRKDDSQPWKKFKVEMEMVPSYTANRMYLKGGEPA